MMLLSVGCYCNGQSLLANGSFEEENICIEYHRNCSPEGWIGTTLTSDYYFEHPRLARTGLHFTAIIVSNARHKLKRSYLRSRLLCGLRKGNLYQLEFFVRSRHKAFDSLGVWFAATDPLLEQKSFTQLSPALIYNDTASGAVVDTLQWQRIRFIFTATGDEIFIAIGSFKKSDHDLRSPADNQGDYYVYLDDVSLNPLNKHELLCPGASVLKEELYGENERHEMLVRKTKMYKNNPPKVDKPGMTTLLKIDTLIIPDILFTTGSARLNDASSKVLDSFCTAMSLHPFDSVIIAGHTDSVGTLIYNTKLSADRAKAVANHITQKVTFNRRMLRVRYHAYLHPVASNATPEGRQKNRRVEILLYRHE